VYTMEELGEEEEEEVDYGHDEGTIDGRSNE